MKPMPEKAPSFLALVLTAPRDRESGLAMVLTFALTQSASAGPNIDCHDLAAATQSCSRTLSKGTHPVAPSETRTAHNQLFN